MNGSHRSETATWPPRLTAHLLLRVERSEEAVLFAVWPGGEVHRLGCAAASPISELERPESVNHERFAISVTDFAYELSRRRIVGIDLTVAEIADPQFSA